MKRLDFTTNIHMVLMPSSLVHVLSIFLPGFLWTVFLKGKMIDFFILRYVMAKVIINWMHIVPYTANDAIGCILADLLNRGKTKY